MNFLKDLAIIMLLCVALTACEDKEGLDETFNRQTYDVQGKVEKGAFVSGSTLSIQPMDGDLQVLGSLYNTTIVDNLGNFMVGSKEFGSPYAELMATGYFFNEVEGVLSNGTLTLRAIVDLSNSNTVNVNVLTHLKYARIKNLVASGKSFTEANNMAQKELFKAFSLEQFADKEVSSFSIAAGTDEAAALIGISSLLLVDRSEAALTEFLAKLSEDFGKDGVFTDEVKSQIEADKIKLASRLTDIKDNIVERYRSLGIDVKVKDIAQYIDWDGDGKAGNETLQSGEVVVLDKTSIYVPNEGGAYTIAITSPIAVYLEPQIEGELNDVPTISPEQEVLNGGLYEGYDNNVSDHKEIGCQIELADNTLYITVAQLQSNADKHRDVVLYDYVGNTVATLTINQAGMGLDMPDITEVPLLGEGGRQIVNGIAQKIAAGLREYNLIEQYYNYNKGWGLVDKNVSPTSSCIANAWSELYTANANILALKNMDEKNLNVYADYCNILSAICYSNLVYGWGNVPYIRKYSEVEMGGVSQEYQEYILKDLEYNLRHALTNLPEKKNESAKDINGFFFASKDVARALLANIYLYTGSYNEAESILKEIIETGFYEFDTDLSSENLNQVNAKSNEVIFALLCHEGMVTRSGVTIEHPAVMPYLTLTDVMLSLAECKYMQGDVNEAEMHLDNVLKAKNITVSDDEFLMRIKSVREQTLLYSGTYFAFLKRTGLAKDVCDIEDYRLLLPIPRQELDINMNVTQNPGY